MSKSKNAKTTKKIKKVAPVGLVHIYASFNNTIVTISDGAGNCVFWSSAGQHGFKGARKSTPYAAQITAESAMKRAIDAGMKTVSVKIKGPGGGREAAVRAIAALGVNITAILDITPIAFNGCRPPKDRRV